MSLEDKVKTEVKAEGVVVESGIKVWVSKHMHIWVMFAMAVGVGMFMAIGHLWDVLH